MPNPGYNSPIQTSLIPSIRTPQSIGLSNYIGTDGFPLQNLPYITSTVPQNVSNGPSFGDMLGSALGSGSLGSIFGSMAGFILNGIGQTISRAKNVRMQEALYDKYYSPAAQMQQMREAGINSNAAAQGIAGAGAASMPSVETPAPIAPGMSQFLGDIPNQISERRKNEAAIDLMNTQQENIETVTEHNNIENKYFDAFQSNWLKKAYYDGEISKSNANMLAYDEYYHGAEAYEHWQQTMIATQQAAQQLRNMQQQFFNECAEYQVLMTQAGLNSAQIQKVWSDIGLNNAMIEKIGREITSIDVSTLLMGEQLKGEQIKNRIQEVMAQYEERAMEILQSTGYDLKSSVNANYMSLCAQGKFEEAEALMGNAYDYARGQYGAKDARVQKWISVGTGALCSVAGAIAMFVPVPGARLAGAGLIGYGASKIGKSVSSSSSSSYGYDDFSHIPD